MQEMYQPGDDITGTILCIIVVVFVIPLALWLSRQLEKNKKLNDVKK